MSACKAMGTALAAPLLASTPALELTTIHRDTIKYAEGLLLIGALFGCLVVTTVVSQGL